MGKPSHRSSLCGLVMIPTLAFFLILPDLSFSALADFVPPSEALSDYGNATLAPGIFRRELSSGSDDHSCSKDKKCLNGACCGASGWCGYGQVFCGDGCMSNCDAKAECGKDSADGSTTCPLNVCCSQFGFCGTTTVSKSSSRTQLASTDKYGWTGILRTRLPVQLRDSEEPRRRRRCSRPRCCLLRIMASTSR